MRTESQPIGRLLEQFQATAFVAHPYKQPVVGYMSDLESITITDAEAFFTRVLRPLQPRDGHRRRRRRRDARADARELLRSDSRGPRARAL